MSDIVGRAAAIAAVCYEGLPEVIEEGDWEFPPGCLVFPSELAGEVWEPASLPSIHPLVEVLDQAGIDPARLEFYRYITFTGRRPDHIYGPDRLVVFCPALELILVHRLDWILNDPIQLVDKLAGLRRPAAQAEEPTTDAPTEHRAAPEAAPVFRDDLG